jgi:protein tyrosine/serine phosphatase
MIFARSPHAGFKSGLLACGLVLTLLVCFSGQRGLPPQEGILNFGKVSEVLYRGAQPDEAALKNLQRLGIKAIINLRMPGDVWKAEASAAQVHGIVYTNLPLRGLGRPADEQVKQVLALIETLPGPVFIHCEHGCDRTGTIVACYRIKHDQWTGAAALEEARKYGMSKWERGMRRFVLDFAKAISTVAPAPPAKIADTGK